jgi:hypothetical protein
MTKEFIINNFIDDNGQLDRQAFLKYYDCDSTSIYKLLKILNNKILNYEYWNNREYIINNFLDKNNIIDRKIIESFFGCERTSIDRQLKKLKIDYNYKRKQFKRSNKSKYEYKIINILKKLNPNIKITHSTYNIISPLELDIFLPEYNIAIEFNGLYWHSYSKNNNVSKRQGNLEFHNGEILKDENYMWENTILHLGQKILNGRILYNAGKIIYKRKN